MSRSRQSAKAAGACIVCGALLPEDKKGSPPRKYCSADCTSEMRRRRYAANPRPRKVRPSVEDRLWARVDVRGPDECWEWQGYRMPSGHGQISGEDQVVTTTHRVAWSSANGRPVPEGLLVRHSCDNPPCCNPAHLLVGTVADNSRDAVERGRVARGFALPGAVLSEDDVRSIRRRYLRFTVPGQRGFRSNSKDLAQEYGVSRKYVAAVAAGGERKNVS